MRREGSGALSLGLPLAVATQLGRIAGGVAAVLFLIVAMATMGAAGLSGPLASGCLGAAPGPTAAEITGLPQIARPFAPLYAGAAERYGLGPRGPAILASIHQTESGFGTNQGPSSAGAEGHMQVLPGTWSAYGVDADGDGRADPASAEDAIYSAANYLHASGAPGDWYAAIFAYNHADWYVAEILAGAEAFGDLGAVADATTVECAGGLAGGPVDLSRAVRVYEPRAYASVPARWGAYGQAEEFDARLVDNLVYVLGHYHLRLIQGRSDPGSPSETHGHGTAADMGPAPGYSWDETALRLATDLGWTRACGSSGERPACDLVPAIANVYYDGFAGHGEGNHIHVGWQCACTYAGATLPPAEWVMAFPSPAEGESRSLGGSGGVLVVGDSLSAGTRPYLENELGSRVEVDARTSRSSSAGLGVLEQRLDSDQAIVVFDLGTNDDPDRPESLAANLRRARELAGGRCLVVATVNRAGAGSLNRVVREFANSAPGVELFDWHAAAQRPGLLAADGCTRRRRAIASAPRARSKRWGRADGLPARLGRRRISQDAAAEVCARVPRVTAAGVDAGSGPPGPAPGIGPSFT